MFKKWGAAIGFTGTERKAVIFLLTVLFTGLFYKYFFLNEEPVLQKFDYSLQDSIFIALSGNNSSPERPEDVSNKDVDYKQEVLDFNKDNFKGKKRTDLLSEKSININKAQLNDLIMLPGIGEATARNILSYREENGGFKKLEELMNVKRIGEKRFNQVKKYLYIE